MDRLVIKGKADLKGSIKIKGSTNTALPIMVSALLSKKTLKLKNLPKLDDIKNMSKLLTSYGAVINTSKDNLEKGFDTVVEENGRNFSVGQKQRIGVARALYRDPELLIFDESTSSLDKDTEEKYNKNI